MTRTKKLVAGSVLAVAIAAGGLAAIAQERGEGRGQHHGMHGDHGMRGKHGRDGGGFGPAMLGGRVCGANEAMAPRMLERLEGSVRPTDAQKADFDALKAAANKAEATLKAACPTEAERADRSPTVRLALTEKHMAGALEAIRTIRPSFDAFYAKLDDKQRDRLRWMDRR